MGFNRKLREVLPQQQPRLKWAVLGPISSKILWTEQRLDHNHKYKDKDKDEHERRETQQKHLVGMSNTVTRKRKMGGTKEEDSKKPAANWPPIKSKKNLQITRFRDFDLFTVTNPILLFCL